jgi:hypothetical protein
MNLLSDYMKKIPFKTLALVSAITAAMPAQAITVDELAQQFEAYKIQQAGEFNKLREENSQLKSKNTELKNKIENTEQQVINNTAAVETVADAVETSKPTGSHWYDKTSIGGYGELHYNNYDSEDAGQVKDEIDLHRFVLFFNHEFSDKLHFYSELEIEHSITGDGWGGEVELEQAWFQYQLTDEASLQAGLFLIPIGITNQNHLPTTFYGVERNEVEKYIIPTTWWEAGLGGNYNFSNGISIHGGLTSGLSADDGYIRRGRGKISKQNMKSGAVYGGAKYTGLPGLEVALNVNYQMDMDQEASSDINGGVLTELHAIYSYPVGPGKLTGKALYSRWDIDTTIQSAAHQSGWYVEPSYRLPTPIGDIGVYSRYEELTYSKKLAQVHFNKWELGFNYWVLQNVVLKFDYFQKHTTGKEFKQTGFDLGIGYSF